MPRVKAIEREIMKETIVERRNNTNSWALLDLFIFFFLISYFLFSFLACASRVLPAMDIWTLLGTAPTAFKSKGTHTCVCIYIIYMHIPI